MDWPHTHLLKIAEIPNETNGQLDSTNIKFYAVHENGVTTN
jgi:hypothetical protein